MNKKLKQGVMALTVSGLLLSGGLVGAQSTGGTQSGVSGNTQESSMDGRMNRGHRSSRGGARGAFGGGLRGLPLGRFALGTPVEVTFYGSNPAENGNVLETLNFTYGEDSEAGFAEAFAAARESAQYVEVNVGEQTRTVNLAQVEDFLEGRGLLPRELASGRGLEEGDSVATTFYDGDPEAGGSEQQTLTFTYGQDSAAGFAASFTDATQDASFVTVTTSPQSYTLDLSARAEARGSGGRAHR